MPFPKTLGAAAQGRPYLTLIGVGPVLLLAAKAHQVLEGDVAEVSEEQYLPKDHQRQRAHKFA
jgi:hypothetical protein